MAEKIRIICAGKLPAKPADDLHRRFDVISIEDASELDKIADLAAIRGAARNFHTPIDRAFLERLPNLEILANFGVGYDGIDLKAAAERGLVVTNTPDVLTEETADTALGLLLMTVRELSAAERHLRAGKWPSGAYPLTATLARPHGRHRRPRPHRHRHRAPARRDEGASRLSHAAPDRRALPLLSPISKTWRQRSTS